MVPVGGVDWTGIPAATAKATLTSIQRPKRRKAAIKATFLCMVPVGDLIGQALLPPRWI
ncbi:hypothetical protein THOE12_180083 [Vibrio rotiferianus]|nr:hypothetical protein THOE12_180083 [Vibrio rotiferianus]